jgi:hypothetical protein
MVNCAENDAPGLAIARRSAMQFVRLIAFGIEKRGWSWTMGATLAYVWPGLRRSRRLATTANGGDGAYDSIRPTEAPDHSLTQVLLSRLAGGSRRRVIP